MCNEPAGLGQYLQGQARRHLRYPGAGRTADRRGAEAQALLLRKVSLTKRQTVNAQAYDLYLRGQDYLYRLTKRSVERAIQLFEKAIELDPRYAAAYAGCSSAYGQMYWLFARDQKYRDRAQELSFKALMYDNNLAEAYTAMGLSYFIAGKFEEASASSRKAIELDPEDSIAHWTLGRIHFSSGEFEQAYGLYHRVIELKPEFLSASADLKMTCERLGRQEEAELARDRAARAAAEPSAAESGRCAGTHDPCDHAGGDEQKR